MPFSKIIEDVGLGGAKVLTDIQGIPSEVMADESVSSHIKEIFLNAIGYVS